MLYGKELVDYALSMVGTPYFYGAKVPNGPLTESYMLQMHKQYPGKVTTGYMNKARTKGNVGKVNVDCSGLISAYTKKVLGSSQLYSQAYTRLPISKHKDFGNGVVLWRSGHVGIYYKDNTGAEKVIEAKGIDYGTVVSDFVESKWSYGLTFSWMNYTYTENVDNKTWKQPNPYHEPLKTIYKGCKDTGTASDVKWVQYELREAGFDRPFIYKGNLYGEVKCDGSAGKITDAAIRSFQESCKLTCDGKVGPATRKAFKEN